MGRLFEDLRPKVAARLMEVRGLEDVPPLTRFQSALFGGAPAPWWMVFVSLSELIEPPACEVEVEEVRADGRVAYAICRCSRCGADPWAGYECVTSYCPECGARVTGRAAPR